MARNLKQEFKVFSLTTDNEEANRVLLFPVSGTGDGWSPSGTQLGGRNLNLGVFQMLERRRVMLCVTEVCFFAVKGFYLIGLKICFHHKSEALC